MICDACLETNEKVKIINEQEKIVHNVKNIGDNFLISRNRNRDIVTNNFTLSKSFSLYGGLSGPPTQLVVVGRAVCPLRPNRAAVSLREWCSKR